MICTNNRRSVRGGCTSSRGNRYGELFGFGSGDGAGAGVDIQGWGRGHGFGAGAGLTDECSSCYAAGQSPGADMYTSHTAPKLIVEFG